MFAKFYLFIAGASARSPPSFPNARISYVNVCFIVVSYPICHKSAHCHWPAELWIYSSLR